MTRKKIRAMAELLRTVSLCDKCPMSGDLEKCMDELCVNRWEAYLEERFGRRKCSDQASHTRQGR